MAPARQHATAPNVHVLETIVLFNPQRPLCFLSNGTLVGHIWVNCLNTFTSLNECCNKGLLFSPTTKSRQRSMKPLQIKAIFISRHAAVIIIQRQQCWLSWYLIVCASDAVLQVRGKKGLWFKFLVQIPRLMRLTEVFFLLRPDHKPPGLWTPTH